MLLRRERTGDATAIHVVHLAAFSDTTGDDNAPEARLVDELRADGALVTALSIVAEIDGEIVGHVACSRGDLEGIPFIGLAPIGVLPTLQGRGVGHALMHAVLGAADALDEPGVILLGDPGYYSRFGFALAGVSGIDPPDPDWAPHFQLRKLQAWRDGLEGTYRYAAAFDRL